MTKAFVPSNDTVSTFTTEATAATNNVNNADSTAMKLKWMKHQNLDSTASSSETSTSLTKYRNNADSILPVFVNVNAPKHIRDEQIRIIIQTFCPFLLFHNNNDTNNDKDNNDTNNDNGNKNDLIIKPLDGGLSNELFTVSSALSSSSNADNADGNSFGNTVLLRIHPGCHESNHIATSTATTTTTDQDCNKSSDSDDTSDEDEDDDDFVINNRQNGTTTTTAMNNENDNVVSVVNRAIENRLAAWLSQEGMAPTYFGRFENGRVEEFYSNVIPLSCHEMAQPQFGTQIARALAKFHQLQAPETILPKPNQNNNKDIDEVHVNNLNVDINNQLYGATIFETVNNWLSVAKKLPVVQGDENIDTLHFLNMLQTEWDWLYNELQSRPKSIPSKTTSNDNDNQNSLSSIQIQALDFIRQIVVTHMDCQSLNILKPANEESSSSSSSSTDSAATTIRLIDFEYAGWNPRAADIANTFCEHCDMNNMRANYETEYPTEEQQNTFFLAYLQQADPIRLETLTSSSTTEDNHPNATTFSTTSTDMSSSSSLSLSIFLETLRYEVGRFALLSHLGWSVWSILKANEEESTIDFDYIQYARHRMDGYNFQKSKLFQS